jgi:hypothetical protein
LERGKTVGKGETLVIVSEEILLTTHVCARFGVAKEKKHIPRR